MMSGENNSREQVCACGQSGGIFDPYDTGQRSMPIRLFVSLLVEKLYSKYIAVEKGEITNVIEKKGKSASAVDSKAGGRHL